MNPEIPDPPDEFASKRLLLRAYPPDDAGLYFRMIRENWDHLYEFLPSNVEAMLNETDAEVFIRWLNSEWLQRNLFLFDVWETISGNYTGETYLANPDWHVPSIELGYFVVRANTGVGRRVMVRAVTF